MPQIKTMLYFDSLHKFAEPKELFSLITTFINFYCLTRRIQQINWNYLLCDQQKTDKDCGMFCCLNAYFFLNGYSPYKDEDSLAVRYWIAYQCNRFHFEFQKMKEKIELYENDIFEILSISRDIHIKDLPSLISPKDRRPSHYENVFKDIKALFSQKTLKKQFQVQVKVLIQERKKLITNTKETKKIMKTKTIPLKIIFEESLKKGIFPDIWKKGNIIPAH